jgi:succinoglycan biosynthesis transport protein ExoP
MNPNDTTAPRAGHGSARDFLAVLFRRRWIIAAVFAITTVTVLAINFTRPLFYESTGKVILRRGEKDNLLQGGLRTMTWEEELASEVETVKSDAIISQAQVLIDADHKAQGRPPLKIDAGHVDAQVVEKSNVLAMSYESRDPKAAQEVTGALITAYMNYRKSAYVLQFPKEFFDSELARVSKDLDTWTERRESYMAATGTVDLGVQGVQEVGFAQAQKTELARIDQELAQKRSELTTMKSLFASATSPEDLPFFAEGEKGADNIVIQLKNKLNDARVRLRSMETVYVPESSELSQQRSEVANLSTLLENEITNRLKVRQAEVSNLEARRSEIQRSFNEGEGRLASYPARSARLSEYTNKIDALQKEYQELTRSAGLAKISKATSPEWTVALLTPPGKPYAKNQRDYVRLALAPIFSLIVGLGLAFFIDGLDATLKNPRETEDALELPVLATLNEQKRRRA